MRTLTLVLIGIGLTLLSSIILSFAQLYYMYKFEIYAGMSWLEFIQWHAWEPGFKIFNTFHGIPHDLIDGVITWFPLLLPGVMLLVVFHPLKKPQKVVLGVLILFTIIDLCWLLLGCGAELNAPEECYVPTLLHLGLSGLAILGAIPLRLAVREELRRAKEEGRE